ncbi:hypothetical protein L6R53_27070 [Myxococcota bacterium]|nr:hypothetical protein [Myxococcota bacterium]
MHTPRRAPGLFGPALVLLALCSPAARAAGTLKTDGDTPDDLWTALCEKQRARGKPLRPFRPEVMASRGTYYLCADLSETAAFVGPSTFNRADHPLPHSEVILLVKPRAATPWSVEVEGERGIWRAGVWSDDLDAAGQDLAGIRQVAEGTTSTAVVARNLHRFRPGDLDVTVHVGGRAPGAEAAMVEQVGAAVAARLDEVGGALESLADTDQRTRLQRRLDEAREGGAELEAARAKLAAMDLVDAAHLDRSATARQALATALGQVSLPATWAADDKAREGEVAAVEAALRELRSKLGALVVEVGNSPSAAEVRVADMVVEGSYVGVLRLGIGMGLTLVADSDYTTGEALAVEAEGTLVVQEASRGPAKLDLLTGYTHYFSRRATSSSNPSVGLTGGLSLASFSDAGEVEALDMAYVGLEWGWKEYGLAATFTLRRGELLRDGLVVGQAVHSIDDPEDLTTGRLLPGLSLVFYPPTGLLQKGVQ